MTNTPDWDLWRSFLAVMDAGSLSGAARLLGVAQPTVGRHIETLEATLAAGPLFTRSPGGFLPTRAAQALEPHARSMAAAAGRERRRCCSAITFRSRPFRPWPGRAGTSTARSGVT